MVEQRKHRKVPEIQPAWMSYFVLILRSQVRILAISIGVTLA